MTWLERQTEVLDLFNFNSDAAVAMDMLMATGKDMPPMWTGYRDADNMLQGCISLTYFVCERTFENTLHIDGWSNSGVMQGVIWAMHHILNGVSIDEIDMSLLNWHNDSGLMQHLTPQRQGAVLQIIKRIDYAVREFDKA